MSRAGKLSRAVGSQGDARGGTPFHTCVMTTTPPRSEAPRISFHHVTKRYGAVTALDDFSVEVSPGRITAFLGANGSGKTTSMRILLGLAEPTAGAALIGNRRYHQFEHPLHTVGAVLDQGFQPNRSARNHLRIAAAQAGVPRARVENVLELVGLMPAARRRVGGFSLGMRQRLALASALIGDPAILVMDEPFNGLDPDGIATMRTFLRQFADNGGTVFLSSHLLAEVAHSADDAIIIDRGQLVTAGPIAGLLPESNAITVTSPDADKLAVALGKRGATVRRTAAGRLTVQHLSAEHIGRAAIEAGAVIVELRADAADLETIFESLIHPKEHVS
jgi:ABC-2 type transport system ATP-binding protein